MLKAERPMCTDSQRLFACREETHFIFFPDASKYDMQGYHRLSLKNKDDQKKGYLPAYF